MEPNLGGSLGLTSILNQFVKWSTSRNRPLFDLYVINMLTMLRNNYKKGKDPKQVIEDTVLDIEILFNHIDMYGTLDKLSLNNPRIILYLPEYVLPLLYVKKSSPSLVDLINIQNKLKKELSEREYQQGIFTINVIYAGNKGVLPKNYIVKFLENKDKVFKYKRTLLFSHIALDFHLYKNIIECSLFESYTGKIKKWDEFGNKVFSLDNIPFIHDTHLLLGDNTFIKHTLNRSQTKALQTLAISSKWKYKPESIISNEIRKQHYVDANFFNIDL